MRVGEPGSTFVKVCGITRLADARAAVRAGANAVGFVLARSPRRIPAFRAARIVPHVHPSVRRFGVFVDLPLREILDLVDEIGLDSVQLQGGETPDDVAALKDARRGLFVAKVVRPTSRAAVAAAGEFPADAIFLDPKDVAHPGRRSRPVPVDWLRDLSIERLVVAGGLTPRSVGSIVRDVRPWGVDVSSGVEEAPGRKDHEKVKAFLRAVRRAEASVPA